MTRREFTKLASSAAIAAGASLPACGPTSTVLRPDTLLDHPLDGAPLRDALLAHAALAPSSHNTQPWRVHVESPTRWIVGPDPLRQLTAVDPEARELVLSVPQLDQRAGLRYHLEALAQAEVGPYLAFRLRAAGHRDGALFEPAAVGAVAASSRGVPREINRIARLSMSVAAARAAATVSERDVRVVTADLSRQRGAGA